MSQYHSMLPVIISEQPLWRLGKARVFHVPHFDVCREANAVIACGIGDAQYGLKPERGFLLYAINLDLDLKFVRELTGGVHYSDRYEASESEGGTAPYTKSQILRLACVVESYTMQFHPEAVSFIDKHKVITNSLLWRSTVADVFENEFPAVPLYQILVDTAAMFLSFNPTS